MATKKEGKYGWIKVRDNLHLHPKVIKMATMGDKDIWSDWHPTTFEIVGEMLAIWGYVKAFGHGSTVKLSPTAIEDATKTHNILSLMREVGWAKWAKSGVPKQVEFPGLREWWGIETIKPKAMTSTERSQKRRAATACNGQEESREDKSRRVFRDELFNALAGCFGAPKTKSEIGAMYKAANELADVHATPREVRVKFSNIPASWKGTTPMGFVRNWSALGSETLSTGGLTQAEVDALLKRGCPNE